MSARLSMAMERLGRLPAGTPGQLLIESFALECLTSGGAFGGSFRQVRQRGLAARGFGQTSDCIFPLPLVGPAVVGRRGRQRQRAQRRLSCMNSMNLVITLVNHLYTGGGQRAVAIYEATAAQARVLSSMYQRLRTFLRDVPSVSGEEFVCKYLRESPGYETWDRGACLPLGETAGVPAVAAGVDLAKVLATDAPLVAEQILHPSALLLPKRDRPRAPRPFMRLAASYPAYVQRCVKAGLQKLLPLRKIYKVKGRPLLSGCFAVPKDDTEACGISALCPLNSFVDATKIPDVKFGMPSRLRAAGGPWLQRLHVSKKDTRHFFHTLALGRK